MSWHLREMKMTVQLMWATQNADFMVAKMARVSNPDNQNNEEFKRLLNYLMKHNHVSPFEMASMCVQIDTTRDISRQIFKWDIALLASKNLVGVMRI